jgi:hypothetical protein
MKPLRLPRYLGGDVSSYLDSLALQTEQQVTAASNSYAPLVSPKFPTHVTIGGVLDALLKIGPTGGVNAGYDIGIGMGHVEDFVKHGGLWCASPVNSTAAMFFSQSSSPQPADTGSGPGTVAIFTLNNNTTDHLTDMWGLYIEPRRSDGAKSMIACEINPINFGTTVASTPYLFAPTGTIANLQLTSGRTDVPGCTNNSYAIGIANNATAFETGILFSSTSLASGSYGGKALAMATSHALTWMGTGNNINAVIRSDSNSTEGPASILFTDAGIVFGVRDGTTGATVSDTGFTINRTASFGGRMVISGTSIHTAASHAAAAAAGTAVDEIYINSSTGALTVRQT